MYDSLGISEKDRKTGYHEEIMKYFGDYLDMVRVDGMSGNVMWATAANSSKAMLGLSRPLAVNPARKVIHRQVL